METNSDIYSSGQGDHVNAHTIVEVFQSVNNEPYLDGYCILSSDNLEVRKVHDLPCAQQTRV